VLTVLVLPVVVGGCGVSSGSDRAEKVDAVAAIELAGSSTARGTMVVGTENGGEVTRYEVEFDPAHHRFRFVLVGDPPPLPKGIPEEMRDMAAMANPLELILIDQTVYARLDDDRWLSAEGETGGPVAILDPNGMLDSMRKLHLDVLGRESIRGIATTHFRADDPEARARYDAWIDNEGRAIRVRTTSQDPPDEPNPKTATIDFVAFGEPVDIEAPVGAKAVWDLDDAPEGDLDVVAQGTTGGVRWSLSTGPSVRGGGCVLVTTTPALDGEVVRISPDGTSSSSYDIATGGKMEPSCGPTAGDDLGFSGVVLLAVGGRHSNVHYMAGLLRPDAEAAVVFEDRTVPLESHDGAFVLVWTGAWPTKVIGGGSSCELAGDETVSGTDDIC
jgi:hypothetical protein